MGPVQVGVVRESAPGENRVALVPELVGRVQALGLDVCVETGAGAAALFDDEQYRLAGASVGSADEVSGCDVLLRVGPPSDADNSLLRPGQVVIGLLRPLERPDAVRLWAERGAIAIALDLLPRTLSRAQSMDALTSQASIAGYKAVIRAADTFTGFFPMMMTAAGTVRPAEVLVLGAGVAGLQAIATARRLGAKVSAYDVRPSSRDEIASLGARFVDVPGVSSAAGVGGYARVLTDEEQAAVRTVLDGVIARSDVVITTAQVPGRTPPILVSAAAVAAMRPGSVVVDAAASSYGGNVEVSQPDQAIVLPPGVTVIGAANLPSEMASAASTAYSRNITAVLTHLVRDGALVFDRDDEVTAGILVTHEGAVVSPMLKALS